ncbi:hypothetical protein ACFPT7_02235 [Acidicapsa dinghuensis]|uniref:Uncharacterized protein n=1 Tax=Acidicapsa dinghuensis TaxID=2218256 RepID=A0ABW1EAX1_9BACT|nr:hypothetical protein [Acidicapsa dinghuensis]
MEEPALDDIHKTEEQIVHRDARLLRELHEAAELITELRARIAELQQENANLRKERVKP